MSIFDKNISENLIAKIIEEFIQKLNFCLSVTYISFPFNVCSKQLFHLDFNEFIEIYEINWLKIKEICEWYDVGKNDKKYLISKMLNENLYNFVDLLEYVYNVISLLELNKKNIMK